MYVVKYDFLITNKEPVIFMTSIWIAPLSGQDTLHCSSQRGINNN